MNNVSFIKALLEMDEELKGGQKKLDVAEPKGKLTKADFAALRAKKSMKEWDRDDDFLNTGDDGEDGEFTDTTSDPFEGKKNVKEGEYQTPKHKIIAQLMGPDFFLSQKPESEWDEKDYDLFNRISNMAQTTGKVPKLKEGGDHEVGMANNSLESIIKSAMELKAKLGNNERDIPGWIQDHITNAENYIDQAAQGFHELHGNGEHDIDELPDGTEELPAGDEEDTEMSLRSMMEDLFEAKKKPSAGLTKKQKSAIAKKAKAGKDVGKTGKGFEKVAAKAAKQYGSKEKGQKVAAAAMWKAAAKKAK